MTFCAIDRQRFTYILDVGTDEFELRKFFQDCRVQLIQRGARVQNIPHGDQARIRVIVNEFPAAAGDTLRKWFSENVTMLDPEPASSIVETFKLHEEVGETIDESLAKRLARSSLVHLFSDSPPLELVEFLRTPIGGIEEIPAKVDQATPSPLPPPAAPSPAQWGRLGQIFVSLLQGQDVDKYLDGLPIEVAELIAGLQAAAQGRTKEAEDALQALPPTSQAREALEQFLRQQSARSMKEVPRGITLIPFEAFDGSYDHDQDDILAYCTKSDPPNAVFVQPIAVLRGSQAQRLDPQSRKKLFPANGDVMAFAGAGFPHQPRRGEMGIWRVEEHETDKATHFHLKSGETRKVFEVFAVPFASTDYDSVREFLRDHSETRPGELQQPLFVMSDGLVVGPRPDKVDLSKEETYEAGLLAWNTLPVLRLEGRMFVIGPLPKEHGLYECASLAVSVRKLLRPFLGAGKTKDGLTKGQLSDLVQYIGSNESGLTVQRLQRIRAELSQIDRNQEALEELTSDLLLHPVIKSRMEQLVQQAVERYASEKTQIQSDITRLRKEREEWEEKLRRQKEDHKKLREETTKVVKAAFEKAKRDSVGTLAELAVFQELTHSGDRSGGISFGPAIREFSGSDEAAVGILAGHGIGARKAEAFAAIGMIASSTGLILSVHGIASRIVVERWAQSIGKGILVDATIGLIDDAVLKPYMEGIKKPDVVAVLDANLSALDIYARPILDSVIRGLLQPANAPMMSVLMSTSDSVGHLPVPASVEGLCLKIGLDKKYEFGEGDLEELNQRAFDPADGLLTMKLWAPACKKLQAHLAGLAPDTQASVLPILIAG